MAANSVAIVTGASQGIGRATAIRLARDFSAIVLVARNQLELEGTANAIRALGSEAMVLAADLREPEAAERIVNVTLERFGQIDALLNIAAACRRLICLR